LPRLIVTEGALRGLERCRAFLAERNPLAAERAGQVIARHLQALESSPSIGRPLDTEPELRELVIGFGEAGYVALYRHEPADDTVYLLAFRHQREAGY
jgi:plasmid stabilization system protein ParE